MEVKVEQFNHQSLPVSKWLVWSSYGKMDDGRKWVTGDDDLYLLPINENSLAGNKRFLVGMLIRQYRFNSTESAYIYYGWARLASVGK